MKLIMAVWIICCLFLTACPDDKEQPIGGQQQMVDVPTKDAAAKDKAP